MAVKSKKLIASFRSNFFTERYPTIELYILRKLSKNFHPLAQGSSSNLKNLRSKPQMHFGLSSSSSETRGKSILCSKFSHYWFFILSYLTSQCCLSISRTITRKEAKTNIFVKNFVFKPVDDAFAMPLPSWIFLFCVILNALPDEDNENRNLWYPGGRISARMNKI